MMSKRNALLVLLVVTSFCAGCNKAPAVNGAVVASVQYDNRIKAIQDDPNLSASDKQRAISIIKQQQAMTAPQTGKP